MKANSFSTVLMIVFCFNLLKAQQQLKFIEGHPFLYQPRTALAPPPKPGKNANYRTYDGTNNNLSNSQRWQWGSSDIPLLRELPTEYAASDVLNALAGANRPSPRKISNVLCDEPVTTFNARGLSTLVYVWGQFLDHDMSLTPTGSTESVPIKLPADEPLFNVDIPFSRSEVVDGTGKNKLPRQQKNLITSWIDASNVYGSDEQRANWLRTFSLGKLKTSKGNLLPFNTLTGEQTSDIDPSAPSMANDNNRTTKTFVAGDVRASEHPGLISMHTLFVREHNRICNRLFSEGLRNDEEIYQKARKEVGALIQAITYQEFLPAMGVVLAPYVRYNPNATPDLMNTFATAAYRLGHTMVSDDILLRDNQCNEVAPGEFDLLDVFWNPQLVVDYTIDPFVKGLAAHDQYETDLKINSVLRNMLFGNLSNPVHFGLDLASINIQRGRDHGLPNYNAIRKFYTGSAAISFSAITKNTALANAIKSLYNNNINDIDLWVGILAEDQIPGKSMGKTLHEMLRVQFEHLRDGDFYFYLNDPFLPKNRLDEIKRTRFSDVIKRNSGITSIQSNVFLTQKCPDDLNANIQSRSSESSQTTDLTLYPNPVKDIIHIEAGNSNSDLKLSFHSSNGSIVRKMQSPPVNILDVSVEDFYPGLYWIDIQSGEQHSVLKFIKL